jgi:CRP-like cAMP-binding protein
MISPELLRRYSFFSGFSFDQLDELAMAADDAPVRASHWFFEEGQVINHFYFLVEGAVTLTQNIPDRSVRQPANGHIMGDMLTTPISVGTLGEQEMFGWSALIPPNVSTAGAQAATDCQVIAFDTIKLRPALEANCGFGHLLTMKTAQIIRERLRMRRIESLIDYA